MLTPRVSGIFKAALLTGISLFLAAATQEAVPPPSQSGQSKPDAEMAAIDLPADSGLTQQFVVDKTQRMTVPVRINGSDPFPFVVDTGAERTVVASDLGQLLSLAAGPELKLMTISGPATVNSYKIGELSMADVNIRNLEAPALLKKNLGAYGLLGIDSLERYRVRIDFVKNEMQVLPSKWQRHYRPKERDIIVVTARRRAGRLVLTKATIGGMRVDLIIDTGAQSSMGNKALRRKLKASQRRMDYVPVGLTSVTGEQLAGDFTQIREIVIGGLTINDLPVTFSEEHAFQALDLGSRPAMLLGMDAMKLFDSVEIDFANKRVMFQLHDTSRLQSPSRLAWKESRTTAISLSSPVISKP